MLRGVYLLADGSAAFQQDAGNVMITGLGLLGLGIVAGILALPTLTLSLLALYVFTLYAMPSAIIGKRPGFSSIAESFQIAAKRFVPTLIIAILIAVISFVVGLVTLPLHFIPFLGPIVSSVITQIVIAFAVLVIVGEYLSLRNQGIIPPSPAPYPRGPSGPVV